MSTMLTDQPAGPGGNAALLRNPQLPQHPLGAYTDAQYEAQIAALRSDVAKKYQDVLQQLGYVDPQTGQFIMGSVEAQANHQKDLLNRQMGLAREDVTNQHQQLGTLFSGLRGTDQARAEFPSVQGIADIDTQTPLTLGQLYEQGAGLVDDYTTQQNQLLAEAAQRQVAGMMDTGSGGAPSDSSVPWNPGVDATRSSQFPNDNPDSLGAMDSPAIPSNDTLAPRTPSPAPLATAVHAAASADPAAATAAATALLGHLTAQNSQLNPNLIAGIGSTAQKKLLPQVGF